MRKSKFLSPILRLPPSSPEPEVLTTDHLPSKLSGVDHCPLISYISCLLKGNGFNYHGKHDIIGFNNGLPYYVKNMAPVPQSRKKTLGLWPQCSSTRVPCFNIALQVMIPLYNIIHGQEVMNTAILSYQNRSINITLGQEVNNTNILSHHNEIETY